MNKFYITTSIPYINAQPHIGHAFEFLLADVLARWHRLAGERVFFLTGTDEHGQKIFQAARQAGQSVEEFADRISQGFRVLLSKLNISNDDFIRTTDKERHYKTAQTIWQKLEAAGDLYKKTYTGLYCLGHEAFLSVEELVDGRCPDHQLEPERTEEENYFFRLSKYAKPIKGLIERDELLVVPETKKKEIVNFLSGQVEDISFSRPKSRLTWGVPVPEDDHIMYVWADALTNYLSGVGYSTDSQLFESLWPADVHLIGKDIARFHAVYWPAMLLSVGLPLPKAIYIHGFIQLRGQKMSKSLGNTIGPEELIEKYGVDGARYLLLSLPSTDDAEIAKNQLEATYRADLVNDLGNLVQRSLTLLKDSTASPHEQVIRSFDDLELAGREIGDLVKNFRLDLALSRIMAVVSDTNRFIELKKPWLQKEADRKAFEETLNRLRAVVLFLSRELEIFLPSTTERIKIQIQSLSPEPLFPRL